MDEEKLLKFCLPWIFLSITYIFLGFILNDLLFFGSFSVHSSIAAVVIAFINNLQLNNVPMIVDKIKVKTLTHRQDVILKILVIFLTLCMVQLFLPSFFHSTNLIFVLFLSIVGYLVFNSGKKATDYFFKKISWL